MNIYRLSLFLTPVSFRWKIPLNCKKSVWVTWDKKWGLSTSTKLTLQITGSWGSVKHVKHLFPHFKLETSFAVLSIDLLLLTDSRNQHTSTSSFECIVLTLLSISEIYNLRNTLAPASLPKILNINSQNGIKKFVRSKRIYNWNKELYVLS
jgi:hypothetical protein